mmetsp:Transcript_27921/g.73663  ORF Transcript_27921/g.73663 Transcript_27921/m.73663 type:complete len:223 (+) Transcript_27921:302-970(+)
MEQGEGGGAWMEWGRGQGGEGAGAGARGSGRLVLERGPAALAPEEAVDEVDEGARHEQEGRQQARRRGEDDQSGTQQPHRPQHHDEEVVLGLLVVPHPPDEERPERGEDDAVCEQQLPVGHCHLLHRRTHRADPGVAVPRQRGHGEARRVGAGDPDAAASEDEDDGEAEEDADGHARRVPEHLALGQEAGQRQQQEAADHVGEQRGVGRDRHLDVNRVLLFP